MIQSPIFGLISRLIATLVYSEASKILPGKDTVTVGISRLRHPQSCESARDLRIVHCAGSGSGPYMVCFI